MGTCYGLLGCQLLCRCPSTCTALPSGAEGQVNKRWGDGRAGGQEEAKTGEDSGFSFELGGVGKVGGENSRRAM